jgi:uncharacterized protein (DUF2235 family)
MERMIGVTDIMNIFKNLVFYDFGNGIGPIGNSADVNTRKQARYRQSGRMLALGLEDHREKRAIKVCFMTRHAARCR